MSRGLKKLLNSKVAYKQEFAAWLVVQAAGGGLIQNGKMLDQALIDAGAMWDEALDCYLRSDAATVAQAEWWAMKTLRLMIIQQVVLREKGWRLGPDGTWVAPDPEPAT